MAFSLGGSVITQSGTDNDLSGLSGIAGVTVRNFNGYTQYDIGSLRMVINGTLNIAQSNTLGDFEQLAYRGDSGHDNNDIVVSVGAEFNIGAFQSNPVEYVGQRGIPPLWESIEETAFTDTNALGGDGKGSTSGRRASLWVRGTMRIYGMDCRVASYGVGASAELDLQYGSLYMDRGSYIYGTVNILNSITSFAFVGDPANYTFDGWSPCGGYNPADGVATAVLISNDSGTAAPYVVQNTRGTHSHSGASRPVGSRHSNSSIHCLARITRSALSPAVSPSSGSTTRIKSLSLMRPIRR